MPEHRRCAVAQALFVSRATVETHLRSVFRKLAVTSRDELALLLSGHPPAADPAGQEKLVEGQ